MEGRWSDKKPCDNFLCFFLLCFFLPDTREQVVPLLPWVGTAVALGLSLYLYKCRGGKGRVNSSVDLSNPKIVNSVDIEDLGNKAVFCRCWRSKKVGFVHVQSETKD